MKTPLDKIANYALLMIWALIIFYLSSEGSDVSSERSGAIVEVVRAAGAGVSSEALSFLTRKAAHIAAYFILGILVYRVVNIYKLKKIYGYTPQYDISSSICYK
jgi:VanZ family protein